MNLSSRSAEEIDSGEPSLVSSDTATSSNCSSVPANSGSGASCIKVEEIQFVSENANLVDNEDEECEDDEENPHRKKRRRGRLGEGRSLKTRGKQKIPIAFMHDRVRRCSTFSKRKTGLMKKAFELAELTGAEVLLLIASETQHVYTFTTNRMKAVIESERGQQLIQSCLSGGEVERDNQRQTHTQTTSVETQPLSSSTDVSSTSNSTSWQDLPTMVRSAAQLPSSSQQQIVYGSNAAQALIIAKGEQDRTS